MNDEKSKREIWQDIQDRHFGQCIWQQRAPGGRGLLEGLVHKATGQVMVIERIYEKRLPKESSYKPFPEMIGLQVYAPVGPDNTWDGLDKALGEIKKP